MLEPACGPGALSPYPLERGATVVSFDLSNSADQAGEKLGPNPRHLVVQASMFSMPFRPNTFDKCFCFGVIQHAPNPRQAFRELVKVLKPKGWVAADCYLAPSRTENGGHRLLRAKYRFRKLRLHRFPPELSHFVVRLYVGLMWPIVRSTRRNPARVELMRSLLFDGYKYRLPGIPEQWHKEFAILYIFDFLSPMYDLPETVEGFRSYFIQAGLTNIDVHLGYNGIEGRGQKPSPSIAVSPA